MPTPATNEEMIRLMRGRFGPVERPLAAFDGARPEAPGWYRDLPLEPDEILFPEVDGAAIEVLAWGERGRPGLLLAHGSGAHARWWGPVAPLLARHFRVVSLSWSGMGGSQWREAYSLPQQVEEIFAAADAGGLFASESAPVFVAHSFGSRAMGLAAAERGGVLAGAVLVDSSIVAKRWPLVGGGEKGPDRRYESFAAALARFNLTPPQPCENLCILHDIAAAGVEEVADGWRWRFDPDYFGKFVYSDMWAAIASPKCPLAFVYGEESVAVTEAELAAQKQQAPAGTAFVAVPHAAHHIMIDQPIALAAALHALAATWQR